MCPIYGCLTKKQALEISSLSILTSVAFVAAAI
jgi:hypothetical protein